MPRTRCLLATALLSAAPITHAAFFGIDSASLSQDAENKSFAIEPWLEHQGKTIAKITIAGRERTAELAILDLLGFKVGDTFDARGWSDGIKKLYNTGAIYDLKTEIKEAPDGAVQITLSLNDKWTLMPYANFQSGGGAFAYGAGFYDVNLGGFFTNASVGFLALNTSFGYDINLYQEWFLDTEWVFGLDFQRMPFVFSSAGATGGDVQYYNLFHDQQQLLVGRRLGKWGRLYAFAETYVDSAGPIPGGASAPGPTLPTQRQWRIRPYFYLGRSNLTNTLEEGTELTLFPVVANLGDPVTGYEQMNFKAKYTHIFGAANNFAAMIEGGVMNQGAAMPYELHLGGFDTVRGFSFNRFFATSDLISSVEFRPRIIAFRWGFIGLDLIAINACFFTDWAAAQSDIAQSADATGRPTRSILLGSVGAGLRFNFVKIAGAIVRVDFAQTVTPSEGWGLAVGVGQFF